ncbi:hypothetical protein L2W58_08815 [Dethiosulfovibrio sp. F2B]|uniref:RraA family protein n=1 Tax=Dethiosulfovibrio faecalis TaxID=2720018 RepID=UPI001F17EDBC|nr:hypothetical protein [Dethiosulfovibrio faecalis]MCF4151897.1 hypothetical protein [Dethiosulfovibrio faecalis]
MIINDNVVTLSNETLTACSDAEPATIGHFHNFGFSTVPFFTTIPGKRVIGRAVTVKIPSLDSTVLHKVTEMVGPGDILMVDRAGDQQYAALGGLVSYALNVRKVEAVIVDGAVTDIDEIRNMGLLVFYRRLSAVTTRLCGTDGEINTPISCGGVSVIPGDIVIADENGFVVLKPEEVEPICKEAVEKHQNGEPDIRAKLDAGARMASLTMADEMVEKTMMK